MTDVDLDAVTLDTQGIPSVQYIERMGVRYPLFTVPQCHVCQSPHRLVIEAWYLKKIKPSEIITSLQDPENVTVANIAAHFRNGHVPGEKTIGLQYMLRKAAEAGVTLEEYENDQNSELIAVELTVEKFRQQLSDPEFQPTVREGLAASKMLFDMKAGLDDGVYDPNDMFVALSTFIAHTRTIMMKYDSLQAEVMMADLGRLLEQDPVLAKIIEKTRIKEREEMPDEMEDEAGEGLEVYEGEVVIPTWEDERDG